MRSRFKGLMIAAAIAVLGIALWLGMTPVAGQAPSSRMPRTSWGGGKPDLSGIWQAINTANWDVQSHSAQPGRPDLGAFGAVPAGLGVVEGNEIPYQPWAAAKKKENGANWMALDPEVKCYLPGVPRATYQPFPFQIVQTPKFILISYEFASAVRTILMDFATPSPVDTWMGHSIGHWDGETLVVDVTSLTEETWFDRAGNFHSDALHVVERYSPAGPDVLMYEATIEDPKVFTRPWKMSMPLYRRLEKNAQILNFKCVEFVADLLWGRLRKPTSK